MRTKKVVEINAFNNVDESKEGVKVKSFYNFLPTKTLNNSKGIAIATFPTSLTNKKEKPLDIQTAGIERVDGLVYFKQYFPQNGRTVHRLLVYGGDKKVYINQMLDDTFDLFWLYNLTFNTPPIALAYKKDDDDAIILASNDSMKIWKTNYSPYTIEGAPIITSMCMHEGVLFCTIQDPAFKVWYATDLDAGNIGNISINSGYISLEDDLGYARKVIAFNEGVYVFRDYGISKVSYVKKDIKVSQVYLSNTRIYTNTISVCGNLVLFMTNEGLYTFNGVKVGKSKINFFNNLAIDNRAAVASSLGEKYYLALNMNFDDENQILCEQDEFVNNILLVVDVNDFSYEIIRGVDIKSMLPVKTEEFEKMLLVFNSGYTNQIGEVVDVSKCVGNNLPKSWKSKSLVEDYNVKLFTKLTVFADAGVKIALNYNNKTTNFTTYKTGLNEFVFRVCCKDLYLEISSEEENATVKDLKLEYYEY